MNKEADIQLFGFAEQLHLIEFSSWLAVHTQSIDYRGTS